MVHTTQNSTLLTFAVVVQSLSHVWLFETHCTAACQAFLSITIPPKFAQTHVHWVDDAIQPSHLLSSPSPLALNLSQHQNLFQYKFLIKDIAQEQPSRSQMHRVRVGSQRRWKSFSPRSTSVFTHPQALWLSLFSFYRAQGPVPPIPPPSHK